MTQVEITYMNHTHIFQAKTKMLFFSILVLFMLSINAFGTYPKSSRFETRNTTEDEIIGLRMNFDTRGIIQMNVIDIQEPAYATIPPGRLQEIVATAFIPRMVFRMHRCRLSAKEREASWLA